VSGYPLHIVGASEAESQPVAEPGWLEWLVAQSPSSPGSAEPPSSAIPSCAPSSTNTAPDKPKHAPLSGLAHEIAHLRTALEAVADNVRRHEERLRRLERRTGRQTG